MAIPIKIPRLGWSMEEGKFLGWLKHDGAQINSGDFVYELEGEKAVQEIESLDNGILRISPNCPKPGTTIPVGTLLGVLAAPGETIDWNAVEGTESTSAANAVSQDTATASNDSAILLDQKKTSSATPLERPTAPVQPTSTRATPRARRAAEERGVDWSGVPGTGRDGRVRERDILAADSTAYRSGTVSGESGVLPGFTMHEIPARRKAIAARMMQSLSTTAQVTLTTRCNANNLVSLRNQFKVAQAEAVPAYTDIIAKLAAIVLKQHKPIASFWFGGQLAVPDDDHLSVGIAVDAEGGLVVPVLANVLSLSLSEIAAKSKTLIDRARRGVLNIQETQGSVFTISNIGGYGIDAFTPILNNPETAILGLGAIRREAIVLPDGTLSSADQMVLSLTFDHRVVDGAPAARFLQAIVQAIENPSAWLLIQ